MNDPSSLLADSESGDTPNSELVQAQEEIMRSLAAIMVNRKVNQTVMLGGMWSFLQAMTSRSDVSEEQRRQATDKVGATLKQMSDYFLQTGAFSPQREVLPPLSISKRSVRH